jgi:hypothetical protein
MTIPMMKQTVELRAVRKPQASLGMNNSPAADSKSTGHVSYPDSVVVNARAVQEPPMRWSCG